MMAREDEIREAISQITEVNEGRAAFYRMLASLFYRELTLEKIQEIAALSGEAFDDGDDGGLAQGLSMMTRAVARADGRTRQQLAGDYAHTFLAAGNYKERMAVPFESVYTSEDGLLMQDARDDVYHMFCDEHLGLDDSVMEPEDHISFECEFMADMADKTNQALAGCDWGQAVHLAQVACLFHANHLDNWIDDLCHAIEGCAQTDFYKGLAQAAQAFIHADADSLADISSSVSAIAADQDAS